MIHQPRNSTCLHWIQRRRFSLRYEYFGDWWAFMDILGRILPAHAQKLLFPSFCYDIAISISDTEFLKGNNNSAISNVCFQVFYCTNRKSDMPSSGLFDIMTLQTCARPTHLLDFSYVDSLRNQGTL